MIEASNICVKFGNRDILKDINLVINKGDFLSIIGPSGAGKSTLLNVISSIENNYSGTVKFNGKNICDFNDSEISKLRNLHIGFVFQDFNLLEDFTVIENIMLPARLTNMNEAELTKKAMNLMREFKINLLKNKYPNELSGGEKQRVAISRAMINKPEIIFADEPTGNLDTKMTNEISKIFSNLNKDGQTIVIVTHNKELSLKARKIIKIKDGKIIES
tara:strand:- start:8461 stop:9114 length:654 start_codon:yes stop_codon:yes gene_type:complete